MLLMTLLRPIPLKCLTKSEDSRTVLHGKVEGINMSYANVVTFIRALTDPPALGTDAKIVRPADRNKDGNRVQPGAQGDSTPFGALFA
jgi:hypothetical protein